MNTMTQMNSNLYTASQITTYTSEFLSMGNHLKRKKERYLSLEDIFFILRTCFLKRTRIAFSITTPNDVTNEGPYCISENTSNNQARYKHLPPPVPDLYVTNQRDPI